MGGRGSSFGVSNKGMPYGTEFKSVLHVGNIKFVKHLNGSATNPMKTRTKNRVYVSVNKNNKIKAISFYKNEKRYKQIDISGKPHYIDGKPVLPHTYYGYVHSENGTFEPTKREMKIIENVKKTWNNEKRR